MVKERCLHRESYIIQKHPALSDLPLFIMIVPILIGMVPISKDMIMSHQLYCSIINKEK